MAISKNDIDNITEACNSLESISDIRKWENIARSQFDITNVTVSPIGMNVFLSLLFFMVLSIFDRNLPKSNKEGARKTITCWNITRFCHSIFSLLSLYTFVPASKIINRCLFRYLIITLKKTKQQFSKLWLSANKNIELPT